jgi:hypothetical protein
MSKEMTVTEALKEGYEFCGRPAEEWQSLTPIHDLGPIDFEQPLFLADKKGTAYSFGKDEIAELLSDVIGDNESQDSGRDDDEIYNAIKEIDFSHTEKQIQDVLDGFLRYKLTDIKLVHKVDVGELN